jgi:hypothetical protein
MHVQNILVHIEANPTLCSFPYSLSDNDDIDILRDGSSIGNFCCQEFLQVNQAICPHEETQHDLARRTRATFDREWACSL